MFGYPGNDEGDLRNEYDFGALESAANRPTSGATTAHRPGSNDDVVVPEDVHVANVDSSQQYSPQEGAGYHGYDAPPISPHAFGPPDNPTPATQGGTGSSAFAVNTDDNKKEGKKKHIMKEVLGMNRKSTKGKTEEEKEQIGLEERWRNALAEEERLNVQSQRVEQGEVQTRAMGNQPNLPPKFLCIHPLVYHSISTEVPPHRQRFVTIAFWNWVAVCILMVMNCGIAIGVGFSPYKDEIHKAAYPFNKAANTALAAVYLIGIPLSFIIWYWRVYRSCSTGRPAQHLVALFGLIIGLAWAVFAFIGARGYGVCGIQLAVHIGKSRQTGVVAAVAVMILLWLAEAGMMCYLIVKEWVFYRKDLAARRAVAAASKNTVGS